MSLQEITREMARSKNFAKKTTVFPWVTSLFIQCYDGTFKGGVHHGKYCNALSNQYYS